MKSEIDKCASLVMHRGIPATSGIDILDNKTLRALTVHINNSNVTQ